MNPYAISPLVCSIFALLLGLFAFIKNPKAAINRSFALLSYETFHWEIFWFLSFYLKTDTQLNICAKLAFSSVLLLPFSYFHFVIHFLGQFSQNRRKVFIFYLIGLFWLIILWSSDLLLSGHRKFVWGAYPRDGALLPFYILSLSICVVFVIRALSKKINDKNFSPIVRNQAKFILFAFLLFACASVEFLIDLGLANFYPIGVYFILASFLVIAYTIVRYHLMDIKVALTRVGIFAVVYVLVLGIPLGLTGWGKYWLQGLFGANWHWIPLVFAIILATLGPFIFLFLQRRAENILLREQRRYQEILNNLSKSMIDIREIEKLFTTITATITEAVKIKFTLIYLIQDEYKSFQLKGCYPKEVKSRFQELIPLNDSLVDILNHRRKPLLSEEIGHQEKINLDSGLVIPCFGKDGLIGFIVLGAKENNQMYTPDDLLVFEGLSYNTSLAIENCTYWKEIEDRQRKARLQEMDTFSYSLAHEIDNPMTIVFNLARFLKDHFLKYITDSEEHQEVQEACDYMIEGSGRVMSMVRAIRQFGQKVTGELETLNLQEVIDGFCKLYLPELKANYVLLEKEIPGEPIFVKGVVAELQQVLIIFAKNAIHAMQYSQTKKITLKVARINNNTVRIAFSDTGQGIKKEDLQTIFAPFVTSKASTEGTGMGLHNAKGFILRHKGCIRAESGKANFN